MRQRLGWGGLVLAHLAILPALSCTKTKTATTPAVESELPPEVVAALPRTDAGTPLLAVSPLSHAAGLTVALAYRADRDDPISRWGECLEQVARCYRRSDGGEVASCIDRIPRCAENVGGRRCCAPACVDAFHDARGAGADEDRAVDLSFRRGDCLSGFAAYRTGSDAGALDGGQP